MFSGRKHDIGTTWQDICLKSGSKALKNTYISNVLQFLENMGLWYLSMLFLIQSNGNLGKVTIPDITVEYQWRHEKENGGKEIQWENVPVK